MNEKALQANENIITEPWTHEKSPQLDQEKEKEPPLPSKGTAVVEEFEISSTRKRWVCFTWMVTWWIPTPLLRYCGMSRSDIQMAWREKLALNLIILVLCAATLFSIIGFALLFCPLSRSYQFQNISWRQSEADHPMVMLRGVVLDLIQLQRLHPSSAKKEFFEQAGGKDLRYTFPVPLMECASSDLERTTIAPVHLIRSQNDSYPLLAHPSLKMSIPSIISKFKVADLVWDPKELTKAPQIGYAHYAVYGEEVFDISDFIRSNRLTQEAENILFPGLAHELRSSASWDFTDFLNRLPSQERDKSLNCLRKVFFVGKLDGHLSLKCQLPGFFLVIGTIILTMVILVKFLASLQLRGNHEPPQHLRFLICQIPCYTEDKGSLKRSIDSVAKTDFDDKHKLLFLTCDGMVIGSGNEAPTPKIVLDILGVDPNLMPEPLSYRAIGEGSKQHNMARVYSGLYEVDGHVVPYVVVVKCGTPKEKWRPGNRGKRDSQLILMQFLCKVHYNSPMSPLELELCNQLTNIIGVSPELYDYILMLDADTLVHPNSLKLLVAKMVDDSRIMGLCGETLLANANDSVVTMIQVYEYYISHHLSKAFESLFGTVTCLPGCFSLYRIKTLDQEPLFIHKKLVEDYAENLVDTLHKKNLLHLGEDRYLTTLLLKYFPKHKTSFLPTAKAQTFAPEMGSILLSQRRRWINSTVHNLFELLSIGNLCGFCCFSMRFLVVVDLIATLIQPTIPIYLLWLVVTLYFNLFNASFPLISIIILASVYGLQAIIFLIHCRFEQIGWMIIYILGMPLFSFFIPLYAFWHFDDFSWGNTRIVMGEGGKAQVIGEKDDVFDENEIPLKTWEEMEEELLQHQEQEDSEVLSLRRPSALSSFTATGISAIHSQPRSSVGLSQSAMGELTPCLPPPSHFTQSQSFSVHSAIPEYSGNDYITSSNRNMSMLSSRNSFIPEQFLPDFRTSQQLPLPPSQQQQYLYPMQFNQASWTHSLPPSHGLPNVVPTPLPPSLTPAPPPVSQCDTINEDAISVHSFHSELARTRRTEVPTRDEIKSEVHRILSCSNLQTMTKKKLRKEVCAFFNMSLKEHRQFVNDIINEVIAEM